ncbi:MAG: hypothetical protein VYD99_01445 [Planctomycetota bacterium]|nr:hypothetical protein [Planctomycetota bacterium]
MIVRPRTWCAMVLVLAGSVVASGQDCEPGQVPDCSPDGDCAESGWIGDGVCDGSVQPHGVDLCCYELDGGDCSEVSCQPVVCGDGICFGETPSTCPDDCGDGSECPDSLVVAGSYDGPCMLGAGYVYITWEGNCLASQVSYSYAGGDPTVLDLAGSGSGIVVFDLVDYDCSEAAYEFTVTFEDGSVATRTACPDCVLPDECGNLVCGAGEDAASCPEDCTTCGDGLCTGTEDTASCPVDCPVCPVGSVEDCDGSGDCGLEEWIGDTYCDGVAQQFGVDFCCYPEPGGNDGGDCTESECTACGDGLCTGDETADTCPGDCFCGDGACDATEGVGSCPADCYCGDGVCSGDEDATDCPGDCDCVFSFTASGSGDLDRDGVPEPCLDGSPGPYYVFFSWNGGCLATYVQWGPVGEPHTNSLGFADLSFNEQFLMGLGDEYSCTDYTVTFEDFSTVSGTVCPDCGTDAWTCGDGACDPNEDADTCPVDCDSCPDDPDKSEPGVCGCGIPDTDRDADGTPDCLDGCPDDPGKTAPGHCGCGVVETTVIGDVDCDGDYDAEDIRAGMTQFGIAEAGACRADTNGDGVVDGMDLGAVLANWGLPCTGG